MKEDKRITQTKQNIETALIELLNTNILNNNYLEEITVKALCEKADINRSTFYAYYTSPSDIYKIIERNAINKISIFLDSLNNSITLYDFFYEVINFLEANKDAFIVITNEHKALKDTIISFFTKQFTITKSSATSYLYEFFFFAFVNVIKEWFSNQLATISELAAFFEKQFSPFFATKLD